MSNEDKLKVLSWYCRKWNPDDRKNFSINEKVWDDYNNQIWLGHTYKMLDLTDAQFDKFTPETDSNQLDLLEKKFIKEAGIRKKRVAYFDETVNADYYKNLTNLDSDSFAFGYSKGGDAENEARLNAILNYINNK